MAVTKNWINNGVGVMAGITLVFGLVCTGLSITLNISFGVQKQAGTIDTLGGLGILYSGEILFLLGLLVFPAAWVAIAAAMSKRYSVYIILLTLSALTFLGAIGVFIHGAVEYSQDIVFLGTTQTDEMAVSLLILLGCTILSIAILLACAICGIVSSSQKKGRFDEPPHYNQHYAASEGGYPFRSHSKLVEQPVASRTIAYGTPEWEKYYRDYVGAQTMRSEGAKDYKRAKDPYRNYSYRY